MGRADSRAIIRKLLSVWQLVGPLAGPVTWSVDLRPAGAALTEPRPLVKSIRCLFKEGLIYEQSANRGQRGLQEKRTRAPSRQPLKIEQLHCDGFG